jgi:hypothetical protein
MKSVLALCVVASASLGLAGSASSEERAQAVVEAERAEAVDCSKQVWPNFSPACLRNVDRATTVRVVTADRR